MNHRKYLSASGARSHSPDGSRPYCLHINRIFRFCINNSEYVCAGESVAIAERLSIISRESSLIRISLRPTARVAASALIQCQLITTDGYQPRSMCF